MSAPLDIVIGGLIVLAPITTNCITPFCGSIIIPNQNLICCTTRRNMFITRSSGMCIFSVSFRRGITQSIHYVFLCNFTANSFRRFIFNVAKTNLFFCYSMWIVFICNMLILFLVNNVNFFIHFLRECRKVLIIVCLFSQKRLF